MVDSAPGDRLSPSSTFGTSSLGCLGWTALLDAIHVDAKALQDFHVERASVDQALPHDDGRQAAHGGIIEELERSADRAALRPINWPRSVEVMSSVWNRVPSRASTPSRWSSPRTVGPVCSVGRGSSRIVPSAATASSRELRSPLLARSVQYWWSRSWPLSMRTVTFPGDGSQRSSRSGPGPLTS